MVSVEEAAAIVFSNLFKPRSETVSLVAAVNKVLAEEISADRDFPPFHRVSMDGIAISFDAWQRGIRKFPIDGVQAAGMMEQHLNDASHCIEAMTGAMLPGGTDTVIPYEDVETQDGSATIQTDEVTMGQNVHQRGQDAKEGALLLEPGLLLSPAEIALLASVGRSNVGVFAFPTAAIVSSGDELVDIDATPEPYQIRQSNIFAVQAAMQCMGWKGNTFHLKDNREHMALALKKIAQTHNVIILSGGVSKGKFDFVPGVLEEIGVTKLFHRVGQRPGKPFWFGKSDQGLIVFALPGNPVSTFMCFYRYIKPWCMRSLGMKGEMHKVVLGKDFSFKGGVVYFLQVSVKHEGGRWIAYPEAGGGSGDFANLKNVDGFIQLPAHKENFLAGELYDYIPFR